MYKIKVKGKRELVEAPGPKATLAAAQLIVATGGQIQWIKNKEGHEYTVDELEIFTRKTGIA